jgi:hypothetical protein
MAHRDPVALRRCRRPTPRQEAGLGGLGPRGPGDRSRQCRCAGRHTQADIDIAGLPTDQQRQLFDAFQLELRYHPLTREVIIRVTVTADSAPILAATLDKIVHRRHADNPGTEADASAPEVCDVLRAPPGTRTPNPRIKRATSIYHRWSLVVLAGSLGHVWSGLVAELRAVGFTCDVGGSRRPSTRRAHDGSIVDIRWLPSHNGSPRADRDLPQSTGTPTLRHVYTASARLASACGRVLALQPFAPSCYALAG